MSTDERLRQLERLVSVHEASDDDLRELAHLRIRTGKVHELHEKVLEATRLCLSSLLGQPDHESDVDLAAVTLARLAFWNMKERDGAAWRRGVSGPTAEACFYKSFCGFSISDPGEDWIIVNVKCWGSPLRSSELRLDRETARVWALLFVPPALITAQDEPIFYAWRDLLALKGLEWWRA